MAEPDHQDGALPDESSAAPPAGHHHRWIWVSALVAIAAVGLGIWAFTLKSDRDDAEHQLDATTQELGSTNEKLDATEQQLEDQQSTQRRRAGFALVTAAAVYGRFAKQLGATNDELDTTQQELEKANKAAAQSKEDAAKAKQDASKSSNAEDKAKAETEQVKAESEAAQSKAQAAAGCAKAYIAALGGLFEGDGPKAQAATVREDLKSVTADCKTALAEA